MKLLVMPAPFSIVAIALVVLGLANLAWFELTRGAVDHEPVIPLAVTRDQAAARSANFVQDVLGVDVSGYTVETAWTQDLDQMIYLEKDLGVEKMAALANDVELWRFATSFARPGPDQRFTVDVAPDGQVVGYKRSMDDDAPGAWLAYDEALEIADRARRELVPTPGTWQLVEATSEDQAARRDWTFIWQRTGYQLPASGRSGDEPAHVQLNVELHGDRADAIYRYLALPTQWVSEREQANETKQVVNGIAWLVGFGTFVLAALAVVARRQSGRDLQWRVAVWLAVLVGLVRALDVVNNLPVLIVKDYTPELSWAMFLAKEVLAKAWSEPLQIALFGLAGEALYRQQLPRHLSLRASFSWRGVMTRSGVVALSVGVFVACLLGPYQDIFYSVGGRFGFWQPASSYFDFLYDALVPWLGPAPDAIDAAFREDFAFRLFAIPLLSMLLVRVTGRARLSQWGAISISAFAWSFTHAHQAHDPFYARGLEVGLMGILLGWLFVRFGILAPIAAHFTFDALTDAQGLAHAGPPLIGLLAHGMVAIPLMIVLVALVRAHLRSGFASEAGLLNEDLSRRLAVPSVSDQRRRSRLSDVWHTPKVA